MPEMTERKEKSVAIELEEDIFSRNDKIAKDNMDTLNQKSVYAIDILGSVGSGKTTLVQQLVKQLHQEYQMASIAGDLTTSIDADRIQKEGAPVVQINTGRECHLDAAMIRKVISNMDLNSLDILLIENVGNLICPSAFPLGVHQRIVVVSTTEGPYMVVKHPHTFMEAAVLVVNKIDLAEAMEVNLNQLKEDALKIKPGIKVVFTNGRTGEGISEFIQSLNLPKK